MKLRGMMAKLFSGLCVHIECMEKMSALVFSPDAYGLRTLLLQRLLLQDQLNLPPSSVIWNNPVISVSDAISL